MSTSRTREKADGELFKSTGIDDNATSTAVTIDANENVGIGAASPSARFEVEDNGSATGGVIMKVTQDDQSSHYGMSVGNDAYSTVDTDGFVVYQMNNGHTYLYNGGVDEGPNIGMPVAGGITFGTDTAAANTLDDYEEGTWTPAILYGSLTITTIEAAHYTKIGNVVVLQAYLTLANDGNGTDMQITGLPFVNGGTGSDANQYSMGGVSHGAGSNTTEMKYCRTQSNASYITFYKKAALNTSQDEVEGNYFLFSITYRTTA